MGHLQSSVPWALRQKKTPSPGMCFLLLLLLFLLLPFLLLFLLVLVQHGRGLTWSGVCVSVLNYENVETGSETDEDDRTLVSEENGLVNGDGGGGRGGENEEQEEEGSPLEASPRVAHAPLSYRDQEDSEGPQDHHQTWRLGDDPNRHLNGSDDRKDEYEAVGPEGNRTVSELDDFFLKRKHEDRDGHPATIAEYLQRSDTAIIYPEAPEEVTRLGTPEAVGQDESEHDLLSGSPDDFSQLLTCPYCNRGYKRLTSLKEHIKYRHEKNEESFTCPLCADAFVHRSQLERHMTTHKAVTDQVKHTCTH
ncbi:zinc finger E-box-binding homeobox 2-like [Anarrhichthys ocellatus]|uniref:zinc finger E-box-binding homeobox 2-like n=1 Tax=Anarrhichthys ocellatus TaxID=433405 RepID=UPI0012ED1DE4|nr:zinc finger E-box-binding homeobox 2-like [Anarrhichthys ocellatus]XP_031694952.1 zinc finger E-box-binding homeobox 2-like [Anarrhichthys ocellatus]